MTTTLVLGGLWIVGVIAWVVITAFAEANEEVKALLDEEVETDHVSLN